MVNRPTCMPTARTLGAALFALAMVVCLCVPKVAHAQSTAAPSWATPVDDSSDQTVVTQSAATLAPTPQPMLRPAATSVATPVPVRAAPSPVTSYTAAAPARAPHPSGVASVHPATASTYAMSNPSPAPAPVDSPEPVDSVAPVTAQSWTTATQSLVSSVNLWGAKAGWKVVWKSSTDRNLSVPVSFSGTFPDAIKGLFELYANSEHPFRVDSYPNQRPAPLVVISEMK